MLNTTNSWRNIVLVYKKNYVLKNLIPLKLPMMWWTGSPEDSIRVKEAITGRPAPTYHKKIYYIIAYTSHLYTHCSIREHGTSGKQLVFLQGNKFHLNLKLLLKALNEMKNKKWHTSFLFFRIIKINRNTFC